MNGGLRLADETFTPVIARGAVKVSTNVDKQEETIRLENTLLVPNLRTNLLSVSKIVDKYHQMLFTKDSAVMQDPLGNIKVIADREGDLFYLQDELHKALIAGTDMDSKTEMWHIRLARINHRDHASMTKNKTAIEINICRT